MALKGLNTQTPVAYVPEIERESDNPTVFWVLPKNARQNYVALNKYSAATVKDKINAVKMFEIDKSEFLLRVKRVDNFQFSDKYPELAQQGVIAKIEEQDMLEKLIDDLDPAIFQEIIDASSKWAMLSEGEKKDLKY